LQIAKEITIQMLLVQILDNRSKPMLYCVFSLKIQGKPIFGGVGFWLELQGKTNVLTGRGSADSGTARRRRLGLESKAKRAPEG
jgi:hypothetical protein